VSRSRSRGSTKKQQSRSHSPVRRGSACRRSRSRSLVSHRSRSPKEHPASKKGPRTPPEGSQSPGPTTGAACRRSHSASPVKNRSGSPAEHRVSRRGPHTPPIGSPQGNRRSQTPAGSPAAGGNPHRSRSCSPLPEQSGRRGPHTPPSPANAT